MGLGGRREKQVIAADPRNTAWLRDTNAPGYKLLTSMGWRPDSSSAPGSSMPSSGADSGVEDSDGEKTRKIGLMAHESSRRLRVIPTPKAGMEGIGYKPAGSAAANNGIGALPTSNIGGGGGSMSNAASSVFSRLGSKAALQFVSAGASKEVINKAKTEGGEFAGLLSRLNAAATASQTPSEDEKDETEDIENTRPSDNDAEEEGKGETKEERRARKKQRKLEKEAAKELKKAAKKEKAAAASGSTSASASDSREPTPLTIADATTVVSTQSVRFNPRMAARARHIASKRMLHSSADALAEILGIAPTPSPGPSSGTATPTGFITSTSLPSTREVSAAPAVAVIEQVGTLDGSEEDKARRKAEKKAAKKAAKAARTDGDNGMESSKSKSKSKKRKHADVDEDDE